MGEHPPGAGRLWLVLTLLAVVRADAPAQVSPVLEGTWRGSCATCAPGAMPDGLARTLVIRGVDAQLSIQRDGFPPEIYRLDGSETQLPDGRTATATVADEGVELTTVRRQEVWSRYSGHA